MTFRGSKTTDSLKALKQYRHEQFAQFHDVNDDQTILGIAPELDAVSLNSYLNPVMFNVYSYLTSYVLGLSTQESPGTYNDTRKSAVKILDWGCGYGFVSYLLQRSDNEIVSCETPEMAASARNAPFVRHGHIDIVELKHEYLLLFPDSEFDVVVGCAVLEHVSDDAESLKEIARILKPGGFFFCFHLPRTCSWTQRLDQLRKSPDHDRLCTAKKAKKLLDNANLTLLDIWHRAVFPKFSFVPTHVAGIERLDQWLCRYTPLKYLATNVEFLAQKPDDGQHPPRDGVL